MLVSHGLGKYITIKEEAGERKAYKILEDLAKDLTFEKLEALFLSVENETCGGIIIDDAFEG